VERFCAISYKLQYIVEAKMSDSGICDLCGGVGPGSKQRHIENFKEMITFLESKFKFQVNMDSPKTSDKKSDDLLLTCNGCFTMFEEASRLFLLIKTVKGQLLEVVSRMKEIKERKEFDRTQRKRPKRKHKARAEITNKRQATEERIVKHSEGIKTFYLKYHRSGVFYGGWEEHRKSFETLLLYCRNKFI
jgi:protein-arginine kinase activator protein McsA